MIRPRPTEEMRLLLTVSAAVTKETIRPSTGVSSTEFETMEAPLWAGVVLMTRLVFSVSSSAGGGLEVEGRAEAAASLVVVERLVVVVVTGVVVVVTSGSCAVADRSGGDGSRVEVVVGAVEVVELGCVVVVELVVVVVVVLVVVVVVVVEVVVVVSVTLFNLSRLGKSVVS